MGFKVGQKVGGYKFLRVLDTSGPTMVYEVENEVARRREILKLLPRGLDDDRKRVDRFLREAKIHSHLSHPNIAEFYSGLQLDGELVMTMEAVEGATLEDRLAEGPVTMIEAVDVARSALEALEYAHDKHVVHRQITPGSLYLLPGGGVKLADFGLAKQEADPQLTQPGTVIGAVHYMSPEQVKGLTEFDGRTDIYALGVVLYEAVTGSRPFDSRSQFDIIQAHVMQPPPPPTDLREDLPPELERVILKALEKFPEERYQSAREFKSALDAIRGLGGRFDRPGGRVAGRSALASSDGQSGRRSGAGGAAGPASRRRRGKVAGGGRRALPGRTARTRRPGCAGAVDRPAGVGDGGRRCGERLPAGGGRGGASGVDCGARGAAGEAAGMEDPRLDFDRVVDLDHGCRRRDGHVGVVGPVSVTLEWAETYD